MPIDPEKKKRYPKNWKQISEYIRFKRAGNKCEWCDAKNYEPHPDTGSKVILTVAHVFDKTKSNCSLDNLAALCQRCHLNHDRKDHLAKQRMNRWKKKFKEKQQRFNEFL